MPTRKLKGIATAGTNMTTTISKSRSRHFCRLIATGLSSIIHTMAIVVIGSTIVLNGCADRSRSAHENQYLIDQKVLKAELKNPDYEWNGPTSVEDRIPNLHAAQALAYRGDSAAIVLFDAIDDPEIEIISIYDAISNLGIPAYRFRDQIFARDSSTVRKWWETNKDSSLAERNRHRLDIGLPPARIE